MLKKIFFLLILISNVGYSQLSNKHWLPPLHSRLNDVVREHYVYLSTPEPIPFQVTVKNGSGTSLPGSPFTISKGNPVRVYIANQQPSAMFLEASDLNKVINSKGLILEGTKSFYASFRVKSDNHAETLILKGKEGLGTEFRLGSLPQNYTGDSRNFVTSFMATENNTNIDVTDYDTDVVFHSNGSDVLSNTLNYRLNAGQVVVISGYTNTQANLAGFVGALVTSDKPIVVNSGNALAGMGTPTDGQDFTLDQIVPVQKVGTEYALVRGNGSNLSEFPLVIATQDNTQIFVNGNTTALTSLNAGDYFLVPNSYYQGVNNKNMYITSNNPIYMYQIIAGSVSDATNGLNFIPPLSCFFQKSVDLIPSIDQIGATFYNSDIIALTSSTAVLSINGAVVTSLPEPLIGNASWVTYKVNSVIGDAIIESTGPLAVGVFGYSGVAGFGGYYSGFGSNPEDTNVRVCSNKTINLFDGISGNPESGGTWLVPAGGAPIVNDLFNPTTNIEGDYFYTFTKICDGNSITITIKVNVVIEVAPFIGTGTAIAVCETDAIIDLFALLGTGAVTGGTWAPSLSSGNNNYNPSIDPGGIYTYSIPATGICETAFAEVNVTKNLKPLIAPITNYSLCDDNADGNDTNGSVTFDLTTKTSDILNGQTGINVTYHTSPLDATNGVGSITSIPTTDRTIYVRLQNATTSCFATTSFELKVLALPVINNSIILKQCDTDNDAITDFNLTEANSILSNQTTNTYTYHTSLLGAQNNSNLITNELSYTAPNGSQVWARIVNTEGCSRTALVNLVVSTTTIPQNHKFTIAACDDYLSAADPANDGYAYFNLENPDVTQNAIQNLLSFFSASQPLIVSFYENESDALAELNAIVDITNYRNITPNSQIIWARIDSDLNNECFGVGPFIQLTVNPLPTVSLGPDFVICVDPITGLGSQVVDATPTATGNYSYEWTPTNPAGNVPTFEITTGGTFSVIVTNLTTNCSVAESITTTFSSEPATFEANLITPAFAAGLSTIEAIATGGFGTYEYSVNTIDWQSSPLFTNLENGSYIVYVRDIQGCGILFSEEIQTITYPNYFTPNGDGYNDYWNITLPITYEGKIKIYDRYGKFLKQLSSYEQGWDGTYQGNTLPSTDYWFIVEYIENDQQKEFKSHFSLKR